MNLATRWALSRRSAVRPLVWRIARGGEPVLTTRAINALWNVNIRYLDDLSRFFDQGGSLLSLRNVGAGTAKAVRVWHLWAKVQDKPDDFALDPDIRHEPRPPRMEWVSALPAPSLAETWDLARMRAAETEFADSLRLHDGAT